MKVPAVPRLPAAETLGPELFFGLVSPLGVGGGTLVWALEQALLAVNYQVHEIHLAGELRRIRSLDQSEGDPFDQLRNPPNEFERYQRSINVGNELCRLLGGMPKQDLSSSSRGQDALVALVIDRIVELRRSKGEPYKPLPRTAYIIRSLKRPGEVDRLRAVYGSAFVLISAHLDRESRVERFATKLAASDLDFDPDQARDRAEKLIITDESEPGIRHGQNVRHAYAKADVFVDAGASPATLVQTLTRFIEALFNYQFHTPTRDEQGMQLAQLASLRSAHLSRQVGAAICTTDGSVVSLGCNEVPRAQGGAYWAGDSNDSRDFQKRKNTSLEVRREVLADTLERLGKTGWLKPSVWKEFQRSPTRLLDLARERSLLMDARVMDALEFDRAIHAEMLAITDAARRGVSVSGCTLFTNTFPCHNCARHIAAAGISRVVYIHPYEKSLAKRLHGDSIVVDLDQTTPSFKVRFEPFVGIAPSLYLALFSMGIRRGDGSRWMRVAKWDRKNALPRVQGEAAAYTRNEYLAVEWLYRRMAQAKLVLERAETEHDSTRPRASGSRDGGSSKRTSRSLPSNPGGKPIRRKRRLE